MNHKAGLLILTLGSFAIGIITDRFLFSQSSPATGSVQDKYLPGITPEDKQARRAQERHHQSDSEKNTHAKDREQGFSSNGNGDPVEQVIREIESGRGMDAATVSSFLDQLPPGKKRREFIERVASHWGRKNPRLALAWSETLVPSEQSRAMERIIHEWAHTDPVGAAGYVTQIPKSRRSLDLVHATGHIWAEQDQSAAIEWARSLQDPNLRQSALRGSVGVWARTDPGSASALALEIKDPYERHAVIESVARHWARQDTVESLEWALGMQGEDRNRATRSIIEEIADHDPKHAANVYKDLLSSSLSSDGSDARIHRDIVREVAERWASINPNEAAEWVVDLPESQRIKREAVQRVADRWASSSPEAASIWALELPEDDHIQRHAVERVTDRWLRSDSMAASEWITQIPEGNARDAAAGELVRYIADSDQPSAFSWATSVSNEGYRTDLMRDVLRRWQRTDPVAARAAVDTAEVTAQQREQFRRILGPSPATRGESGAPESN